MVEKFKSLMPRQTKKKTRETLSSQTASFSSSLVVINVPPEVSQVAATHLQ
jgi:hypothetical protein